MKNLKSYIIPDIHGRDFWKPIMDNKDDNIIFLGDYVDPYPYEGYTNKDAFNCLNEIIEFKKSNPNRVTLLIGNHDFHYICNNNSGSRYSIEYAPLYKKLYNDNKNLFEIAKFEYFNLKPILFTHAGIDYIWWDEHKEYIDSLKMNNNYEFILKQMFNDKQSYFSEIGPTRWGMNIAGSPIWSDCTDDNFIKYDKDLIQIVGHTQLRSQIYHNKDTNVFCTDVRKICEMDDDNIIKISEKYNE